jgi:hypothetical protein
MASVSRWYDDQKGELVTAGSSNAYTLTTNSTHAALADQSLLVFRADRANTGAATLNVDSLGSKSMRINGAALASGNLVEDVLYAAVYNATDDAYDLLCGLNGTMSAQDADAVAITGGSVTGITDLAIADGGTGASNASDARDNLGLQRWETKRKTADTQRTSSSASADTHLTGFTYSANTPYRITGYLYVVEGDVGDAGGGFNAGFANWSASTVVGACTFTAVTDSPGTSGGGHWGRHIDIIRNSTGDVIDGDQSNPLTGYGIYVEGTFEATASGTMDFYWALQFADAQGTTLKEGSYIKVEELI